MITYLKHTEIDKFKWDACIAKASNSLVYAFSWYLDVVSPNWDALVLNDYEAMMPITHRKKYFISYLFQPFFTQQLGVFSRVETPDFIVKKFIAAIPPKFKFIDINFNEDNKEKDLIEKKNFILPIDEAYADLFAAYKGQAKRNIKKAKEQNFYLQVLPYKHAVDFYSKHKGAETKGVTLKDYLMLKQLYKICNKQNMLLSMGVFSKQYGLVASGVFIINNERVIFHLGTSDAKGKEFGAMHFLIDGVIAQLAGKNNFIDFEGSEKDGIARFYKSFGAFKRPYFKYKTNTLPKILAWLK